MNPARTSDSPGPGRGALDPTSAGRPLIRRTPATRKTPGGPGRRRRGRREWLPTEAPKKDHPTLLSPPPSEGDGDLYE